ncbi:DUF2339 domain-containing protein [Cloacibacterium sp.]|uniref:DUF2339 domain-containing protein n=1 Tax=Cloacibacterium sp. TaxID=1913682 RepID=UPI0039E46A24
MLINITLVILLLIVFSYLNGKINNLENEIRALKKRNIIKEENIDSTLKVQEEKPLHESYLTFNNRKTEKIISDNIIQDYLNKENSWIDEVLGFVKQNVLTIIGILTLVIGIGYFVKYAIDKNWIGETTRFAIGIFTGFGIMAIGYFIQKNYKTFSSIISGGGIAILYLSVTLAFQEYHLFFQNIAFIFLVFITILAVITAYFYNSEVLIIFALIGGFASPLMVSNGNSNYLFLFIYISLLNLGMLAISYLKNWKSIGWFSFFTSYLYLSVWISDSLDQKTIYFSALFYIIFYAFAIRNYIKNKNWNPSDILLLVMINISSLIAITYIFKELNLEPIILFPLIFAGINALLWTIEIKNNNSKIYHPVFIGITLSLITIAVALQFKLHIFTSLWAIEGTLLLFIWYKTKQDIFKKAFLYLLPLVLIAECTSWSQYNDTLFFNFLFNKIFFTGLLISITFGINYYFIRKNKIENNLEIEFQPFFKFLAFANFYIILLLELMNYYKNSDENFLYITALLFTIFYIFALLILSKFILKEKEEEVLLFTIPVLTIILISKPEINAYFISQIGAYTYYLLYIIPIAFIIWKLLNHKYLTTKFAYFILAIFFTYIISIELSHLYIISNANKINEILNMKNHYINFYLPMIWTVCAIVFLFIGLRKQIPDFIKFGFALIGLMAIKLYAIDVWRMDNISRIIAFIILGIILLSSSFMYQKLRGILKELIDKNKNED